jgi:hypothetical protein
MNTLGIQLYVWWTTTVIDTRDRLAATAHDDRGEVTSSTALIVLLVTAAITAGGIIAVKLIANANKVPSP